jgi:hypothetical protein
MVAEGRFSPGTWLLVTTAVSPLVAPCVWHGFSLGMSNGVLGALSVMEQPLTVRSVPGVWAIVLAVAWFGLAYRAQRVARWEAVLVALGFAVALARVGNTWLDALALVLPLAARLRLLRVKLPIQLALCVSLVPLTLAALVAGRPATLPAAAQAAAQAARGDGQILTDWHWAPELQRSFGSTRMVVGAAGLRTTPIEIWHDYLMVTQAHHQWDAILSARGVDTVVLDRASTPAAADVILASPQWRVEFDAEGALVATRSER